MDWVMRYFKRSNANKSIESKNNRHNFLFYEGLSPLLLSLMKRTYFCLVSPEAIFVAYRPSA